MLILFGFLTYSIEAQPNTNMDLFDNEHYFIVGHVYEPYTQDNVVILINTRTGESLKVTAKDCECGMKEYLFNLANLHQGWVHDDEFILSYGNTTTQFNIIEGSIAYQQDIQRPPDVDPIYILTGFLIVAVGGGYFYMRRKKVNENDNENDNETKGSETNMNEEETQQAEVKPCIIDRIFGGTKKALLMLMLLTMIVATLMDKPIPAEFINMATGLMLIYFGAGGVKLGMDIQNKS